MGATLTAAFQNIAQRIELHGIHSLTLTDRQFLTGASDGKPVTVAGEFRIAQGTGPLPVIVLMHGSGGMGPGLQIWVSHFNGMGISTFAIDGFTGRGLTSVGNDQSLLGRLNLIVDIFRALEILEKHPAVDPNRIILMGFSRGGQATIYAAVERFRKLWKRTGADFAAYIPVYPDCGTTYIDDTKVVAKPIRIHHGAADDYNSLANAKKYADRLRAAGADVALYDYANAHHGYDNPLNFGRVIEAAGSQAVCGCDIREIEDGVLINAATGKPFSYTDPCVNLKPHVGGNEEATKATRAAVSDFVKATFGRT
jgi:dienelactone hydrolase